MQPSSRQPSIHRYGEHPDQFGELWMPEGQARGTVVVLHGGFWRARYDLTLGQPLARELAARGFVAWNLEYRRAGAGGGWPETFDDVVAGIDLLADVVGCSSAVAIGHSAGGHLATWAAGRPSPRVRITGVVSQAGVLELTRAARERVGDRAAYDLMGGWPEDCPDAYRNADPIEGVPVDATVLCLHSRTDDEVPFELSARYVEAATQAGGRARLVETTGDHYTLIDPGHPDWELVVDALPSLLH